MSDEISWRTRVENKLDDIAKALTVLARVEERQTHLRDELDDLKQRTDDHSRRIGTLEREGAKTGVKIGFGERLLWAVVTAALGGGWVVHIVATGSGH